jgi:predicted DCC family thiol-disulfide oxidoreductase YuxK
MSGAGGYVVLYDGDCAFCTRWKERMSRRDRGGLVEWLSVHHPSVATRYPDLDRADALRQMYVFAPDGRVFKGADGWMELFGVLEGTTWLPVLGRVPGVRPLMRRVYRAIAARRDRLSCSGRKCRLPPSASGVVPVDLGAMIGLAAAATAIGCVLAGCAAPPDPVQDRLQDLADVKAAEVVGAMLDAYGGHAAWAGHHNVECNYRLEFYGGEKTPQKVTRQLHRFGLGREERVYVEDLEGAVPQIVRLNGEAVEVTRGGAPVLEPSEIDFPRAFGQMARWSFLLPWNLLDPDCRLEYRGERVPPPVGSVPAGPCDVVRLRYDRGGQEGPSTDWYDLYVSRLSRLVDRIHSYRAEDATYRVVVWSDHVKFDDMRVATKRSTYSSDAAGAPGPLEVVAVYSEVRFDAPFKDDIFRGSTPLAATSARE